MKHHPYAVFFDILWDVSNPRGIDADRTSDTNERRDGEMRRAWLRLRRSVAPSAVNPEPVALAHTPAAPSGGTVSDDAPPVRAATADAPVDHPGAQLSTR